jgi:hypothetical protein
MLLEVFDQFTEPSAKQAPKAAAAKISEKPAKATLPTLAWSAEPTAQVAKKVTQATLLAPLTWGAWIARTRSSEHFGDLIPVLEPCHSQQAQEGRHGWKSAVHFTAPRVKLAQMR